MADRKHRVGTQAEVTESEVEEAAVEAQAKAVEAAMVVAAATETAAAEVASLAIGAAMLSPSRGVDPPDRQAARGGALPEHLAGCVRTRASATTTVSTASGGVDMCARQHAGVAKTLLRRGRGPAGARRGRPPGRPVRPRGRAGPGGRLPRTQVPLAHESSCLLKTSSHGLTR